MDDIPLHDYSHLPEPPDEVMGEAIEALEALIDVDPGRPARVLAGDLVLFMTSRGFRPPPNDPLGFIRKIRHMWFEKTLRLPTPEEAQKIMVGLRDKLPLPPPGVIDVETLRMNVASAVRRACVKAGVVPPSEVSLAPDGGLVDGWSEMSEESVFGMTNDPILAFNCHPHINDNEVVGMTPEGPYGVFKPEVAKSMVREARGKGWMVVAVGHPFPTKLQTRAVAEAIRADLLEEHGIAVDSVVLVDECNDPVDVVGAINAGEPVRYVDFAEREV